MINDGTTPILAKTVLFQAFYILLPCSAEEVRTLRHHEKKRPLGHKGFKDHLEETLGRTLHPLKSGPKPGRK